MTTYESIEEIEIDEQEIYEDLEKEMYEEIEKEMYGDLLNDKGTCVDCGDPNGNLCIDPHSDEIYGEPTTVILCKDCSGGSILY